MEEEYDQIPSSTADDDLSLPKATVTKMIQEMLPLGITCPRETRDLLLDCCVEFIHLIASESNEVCEKSNKKTISPEHVLEALKNLSFDAYIEEVEAEYHEHQAQSKSKEKTKGSKLELSGLTEEELLRQQEELFERARLRMNSSSTSTTTTTGSIDAEKEPSTAVAAAAAADNEDNTEMFIIGAKRTPVGSFLGSLSSIPATELGSIAIRGALKQSQVKVEDVGECLMGNVLSADLGQAPARQAALRAGLNESTVSTTINKVCASGMKAVVLGAQSVMLGYHEAVVAGGMESMSRAPFYIDRKGFTFGNGNRVTDSILRDGLWDPKYQIHMGTCAERKATEMKISREAQDAYTVESYRRAREASQSGAFDSEIEPVSMTDSGVICEDEEYKRVDFERVPKLKPAFADERGQGTITAASSSTLSDGASALILASGQLVEARGLRAQGEILAFADAECDPLDFPVAPAKAIPLALQRAGISIDQIDLFEINEAFSAVILANIQLLGLKHDKVNVRGGGVSLGHPIGSSGSRIVVTLLNALKAGQIGCAAVCNGGGGATSIIIKKKC